ncbi:hypothetical protein Tco_0271030 [Tanacetum coccineum]
MTTLVEHIIVAGAENRPPMLEKSMYDSWGSRICLFIKGKKNGRMMLDSIDNGPLVYPTIEEMGRLDLRNTLNSLKHNNFKMTEWSKFVTDVKLAKSLYTTNYDQLYAYLSQHKRHANEVRIMRERYPDPLALDPIDCINKAMTFLSAVASRFPPSNNQLRTCSNPRNQATIQDGRVIVQQTEDLDAYDSDCNDISSAKVVLMATLLSYDSDVLSEVPYSDSYPNDMINQDVQEMPYSEQTHIDDYPDNEINNDSNIIP